MRVKLDLRTEGMRVPPSCVHCKNVIYDRGIKCKRYGTLDIVSGRLSYSNAEDVRKNENECGPHGKDFERQDMSDRMRISKERAIDHFNNNKYTIQSFLLLFSCILLLAVRIKSSVL